MRVDTPEATGGHWGADEHRVQHAARMVVGRVPGGAGDLRGRLHPREGVHAAPPAISSARTAARAAITVLNPLLGSGRAAAMARSTTGASASRSRGRPTS